MNEDREKCEAVLIGYLDATLAFREAIRLLAPEDPAQGIMITNMMNEMNKSVPQMLGTYIRLVLFNDENKLCELSKNVIDQYIVSANLALEMARGFRGITPS